MTPAEELRAAATKLREMTDDLGEWWYDESITHVRDRNGDLVTGSGREEGRWIALMGPQNVELLAVWLETEAHCLGVGDDVGEKTSDLLDTMAGEPLELSVTVVADTSIPALTFARVVLGSPA